MSLKRTSTELYSAPARSLSAAKRSRTAPVVAVKARRKMKHYGQVGPEMKYLEVDNTFDASTTPDIFSMSNLATGSTNVTRTGNKITIKSVECKFYTSSNMTVAHLSNVHRVAIVLDKEPEAGAIATWADIWTDNSLVSMRNVNNSDRFVVLGIEEFGTGQSGSAGAGFYSSFGGDTKFGTIIRKCDIAAKYLSSSSAQSASGSNQILCCINSSAADANLDIVVRTRIRFTDE